MMQRLFRLGIICGVAAACILLFSAVPDPAGRPTSAAAAPTAAQETRPSPGDAGADLVASFYQALLQRHAPTIEQERALFPTLSTLRARLVLGKPAADPDDIEPMKRTAAYFERRRLLEQRVAAAGPVVLEYFRQHKEWFLPVGMKSTNEIRISSLGHFVRSVDEVNEPPTARAGFVIALFVGNRAERPNRLRTIVFTLYDGKIDPGDIRLYGFQGETVLDAALLEMRQREEKVPATVPATNRASRTGSEQ